MTLALAMGWDNFTGLVIVGLGSAYLLYALIRPEKL
jgi:K+-transporting ATPase KdpF subunit